MVDLGFNGNGRVFELQKNVYALIFFAPYIGQLAKLHAQQRREVALSRLRIVAEFCSQRSRELGLRCVERAELVMWCRFHMLRTLSWWAGSEIPDGGYPAVALTPLWLDSFSFYRLLRK